ncbi:hypothetical protein MKZ08_06085 [Viridibacillus sp. FSL R5-0477]|uniref:PCZ2.2 n=1 Tax=Viridibacillus arenosi FSL R5-213 TaxID=1227360 RepID=W4EP36_9BACL|nr:MULTISPECIES: hypothetical protein [Viridibacillus]ETT82373.1 hypothetical protein C176_15322 [Viridibacillus arenosi FSL R5-213]OMC85355.1 hypothetical protein BK130_00860 [Viridibacillus sp. FSL H8-0123]OMC87367.1 hypothetical protein BK128_08030 [Viridibacillus sp. FSL H7-0596]OMC92528.1 hypothetical protein BK137_05675 [Viridibacillus arenosi]QOV12765.1 hypothetical protein JNUCC6_08440 [Viridibacillus sp. JNUCC-6]
MDITFIFISFYLTPILSIIFCLNLVAILKKIKRDEKTATNTFWLTTSFLLIVWSIAVTAILGT